MKMIEGGGIRVLLYKSGKAGVFPWKFLAPKEVLFPGEYPRLTANKKKTFACQTRIFMLYCNPKYAT